jgi:hypothetical protein
MFAAMQWWRGSFWMMAPVCRARLRDFKVSGEVTNRAVFDLNKLEQFPPAEET